MRIEYQTYTAYRAGSPKRINAALSGPQYNSKHKVYRHPSKIMEFEFNELLLFEPTTYIMLENISVQEKITDKYIR